MRKANVNFFYDGATGQRLRRLNPLPKHLRYLPTHQTDF